MSTSTDIQHRGVPSASTPLLESVSEDPVDHFARGDPENPRNWPAWRKWLIVAVITPIDLSVSWGASGFSPATESFRAEFGLSETVATLGLSLYILGLALGPMSLAPLSEFFGRSVIYIGSYAVFLVLLAATALVQDVGGFMALRFLSGLFAAVTIGMCCCSSFVFSFYPQTFALMSRKINNISKLTL